jgi:hypothetical protein
VSIHRGDVRLNCGSNSIFLEVAKVPFSREGSVVLFQALRYKSEGGSFENHRDKCFLAIYLIIKATIDLGIYSDSNINTNIYGEYSAAGTQG